MVIHDTMSKSVQMYGIRVSFWAKKWKNQ